LLLPHVRSIVPPGGSPITAERVRFTRDRPAAAPTVPASLSVLTHAACLLVFTVLLPSRMSLPDIPGATRVAMVFEPAPSALPAVAPAAPPIVHDIIPPPTEPTHEVVPPSEPPPQQAAQSPPRQVAQPPAMPEPVPAVAHDPIRLPPPVPIEVTQRVPKVVPPPPRTTERQAAHSAPVTTLASLTPPPALAPAEAQSAEVATPRPATADPLIPPRPVAGMETNRAPTYPEIALRRHEAGRVMLRVSVSAHGRPLEVDVAQTSGYPILDSAALSAVRQWQFIPAMQAGTPVAAVAEVPVRFQIDN
jgi:periplasmic protein TonB